MRPAPCLGEPLMTQKKSRLSLCTHRQSYDNYKAASSSRAEPSIHSSSTFSHVFMFWREWLSTCRPPSSARFIPHRCRRTSGSLLDSFFHSSVTTHRDVTWRKIYSRLNFSLHPRVHFMYISCTWLFLLVSLKCAQKWTYFPTLKRTHHSFVDATLAQIPDKLLNIVNNSDFY